MTTLRLASIALAGILLGVPALGVANAQSTPVVVTVRDNSYDPQLGTVPPGTTVTWRNVGNQFHTVTVTVATTGDTFNAPLGGWGDCVDDKGTADPSDDETVPCEFTYTFTTKGVVTYHCIPHQMPQNGNMRGALVVA